jgi:peptide/nickel transport system substrate-binding protein
MGLGSPVTVSMAEKDDHDVPFPILAERLPNQSDGSWTVNADGTMKTVYTLRPNLTWHDGTPLTAADFTFAQKVYADTTVPVTNRLPEALMSEVNPRDDRTVEITWKQIYVDAGALVRTQLAPLPSHLLEAAFNADKSTFAQNSFFTSDQFVSDGPYRVTRWEHGVAISLEAFPNFALGEPKIKNIEYRAVADANTIVAGFLAGTIDFSQYTSIDVEQALVLRDRWSDSHGGTVYQRAVFGTSYMEFQHRDVPGWQRAIEDVRVRQALGFSLDKPQLAEALQHGIGGPADTSYPEGLPIRAKVDPVIAKYPYDPRRAETLFNEAGWTRGSDGNYHDTQGNAFDIDVRGPVERTKDVAIISDMWRKGGLNSSIYVVPREQTNDVETRVNFPGVAISAGTDDVLAFNSTCDQAPTAQNRFTGKNRGSYCNPELDRLYNLSLQTLEPVKREDVLVDLERLYTTDLAVLLLEYQPRVAASRAIGGIKEPARNSFQWNIWEWTLVS